MEDLKKKKEVSLKRKSNQKKGPGSRATKMQTIDRVEFILQELGSGKSPQLIYRENLRWDVSERQFYNLYRKAISQVEKLHLANLEDNLKKLFIQYDELYFRAMRRGNMELALKVTNSVQQMIFNAESFKVSNQLDTIIQKFNIKGE